MAVNELRMPFCKSVAELLLYYDSFQNGGIFIIFWGGGNHAIFKKIIFYEDLQHHSKQKSVPVLV